MSPSAAPAIACRITGQGRTRVLLLHALTGGPDASHRPGVKGWWGPVFAPEGPLAPARATVWTPNLPGSCYGAAETSLPLTPRAQARELAAWITGEDLSFDGLVGGSLGGMVALELALLLPERFRTVGVIGCGARADAWLWGTNAVQRAILASAALDDREAIGLARRAAMLSFRTPGSLDARFPDASDVEGWLDHHGEALASRFTRKSYLALLEAMDGHDIGRDRGGIPRALEGLGAPLHILGMDPDLLFPRPLVEELAEGCRRAGRLGSLRWLLSPHGHDAFLMEWGQVSRWLEDILEVDL